MTSNHNSGGNYWGYLIKRDKSAAPLLEQLCLGLAKIIGKLEPGPDTELTPQRLAAFYRSVGGNYDTLFLTSDSGLSFMYKTLGCFHTLQPTQNPFESPSIPALLPVGFAKWQTLQLLLCPGEHVPFMQEAVRLYDVPTPDGGVFPKVIPREAFPDRPDNQMEEWHRMVTGTLEQQHHTRRLKNSPFPSPRDPLHRGDSYFLSPGKLPQVRRYKGSHSPEYDTAPMDDARRRSSVPDLPSPFHAAIDKHRASDAQQVPPPSNTRSRPSQYNSPQRATTGSSQHRPTDSSTIRPRYSTSSHRASNASATYRPVLNSSAESNKQVPPHPSHPYGRHGQRPSSANHHPRPHSPSTVDESTSGSEASSENSQAGRGRNSHEARDSRRRSSLFPPPKKHHLRRHSHDATYLPNAKPPLPPRPNGNTHRVQDAPLPARPEYSYKNNFPPAPAARNGNVQFRNNIFDAGSEHGVTTAANETPGMTGDYGAKNPQMRYFDPTGTRELVRTGTWEDMSRENSAGSGADREKVQSSSGMPLRISTVSGVGGRRYPEPRSAFAGNSLSPKQVGII